MRTRPGPTALLLHAALLAACGGDPVDADAGPLDGAPEDAPREDAGPARERLLVRVWSGDAPLGGATLTLVGADAAQEATTDAAGEAALAEVSLSGDVLHVGAPGMIPLSFSRLPPRGDAYWYEEDTLTVQLRPDPRALEGVTIRGLLTDGDAAGEFWIVSPARGRGYAGREAEYAITIAPGAAEIATVLEFDFAPTPPGLRAGRNAVITRARLLTLPASASDATLDVDLSEEALPLVRVAGSFPIPAAPHELHEVGTAACVVHDADHPGWLLGESSTLAADVENTRVDYEASWIAPAEASRPRTTYLLSFADREVATVVEGYPVAGPADVSFVDVPIVVSHRGFAPWRPTEVATVEGVDPAHQLWFELSEVRDRHVVWRVVAPAGAPVVLPPAPAGVPRGVIFHARAITCEGAGTAPQSFCRRAAAGTITNAEL